MDRLVHSLHISAMSMVTVVLMVTVKTLELPQHASALMVLSQMMMKDGSVADFHRDVARRRC
jgi:hypothetical protein